MELLDPVPPSDHSPRETLLQRARSLIAAGRIPVALPVLQELVDFNLHDVEAWCLVAEAWHRWGHGDRGQKAAELALKVNPHCAAGHLWKSRSLLLQSQKQAALDAAQEGITATNAHPECRRVLVEVLIACQKLPEADANLRTLQAQDPDNPDLVVLAGELAYAKQDYAAAEQAFASVLTTATEVASVWAWLGAVRARQQRVREAVPCYYQAATQASASMAATYRRILVELIDDQFGSRLVYLGVAYLVAALVLFAIVCAIQPLASLLVLAAAVRGWKPSRAAFINWSLEPYSAEVRNYYLTQKPVVDRERASSTWFAYGILAVVAIVVLGGSEFSRQALWKEVGLALLIAVPPLLWLWVRSATREDPGALETSAYFWFPDEATAAVQLASASDVPVDPVENGRALLRGQRLNAARRIATRLLVEHPDNLGAHHLYALTLLASGETEGGLAAAERARHLAPGDAESRALFWLSHAARGKPELALAEIRKHPDLAAAARPPFAEFVRDLAAAGASDAVKEAISLLQEWAPDSQEAVGLKADQFWDAKNFPEAEAAYRRAHELAPDSPLFLNNLGWVAWQRRRFGEALQLWRRSLKADPGFIPALNSLSSVVVWLVWVGAVAVAVVAVVITMLPTLFGRPDNPRMLWMTLAAPFLAIASVKPMQQLAAALILPPLSPTLRPLALGDARSLSWVSGVLALEAALVLHSVQAWWELALHPHFWHARWTGAAFVTVLAVYTITGTVLMLRNSRVESQAVREQVKSQA